MQCKKKAIRDGQPVKIVGTGGWNRTNGLQVMSLTSYLCSTPQQCVHILYSFFRKMQAEMRKKSVFYLKGLIGAGECDPLTENTFIIIECSALCPAARRTAFPLQKRIRKRLRKRISCGCASFRSDASWPVRRVPCRKNKKNKEKTVEKR